ncbi:MAG: DUF2842 domain-containing protein [Hyphomonas sp.]|nr:DUF2842 domain-containing protein [Hyphomonas sp.]
MARSRGANVAHPGREDAARPMRKPVAVLVLLAFMALWIWGAGTVGSRLTEMPGWVQLIFYVVAGFGWILPLRPLLKWMNANQPPEED